MIIEDGNPFTTSKAYHHHILLFFFSSFVRGFWGRGAYRHSVVYAYGNATVAACLASVIALESEDLSKKKRKQMPFSLDDPNWSVGGY